MLTLLTTIRGGLIGHSVGHEAFLWDLRQEPGLISAYSKLWGTEDLIVSFDGGNLAVPGKMQAFKAEKWAHVDQSPFKFGMRCVQGIANLNDNVSIKHDSGCRLADFWRGNGRVLMMVV